MGRSRRDHPRGCGEKVIVNIKGNTSQGSSPRVRGEEPRRRHHRRGRGIIPAGAGRSCGWRGRAFRFGDHPRGCGEKVIDGAISKVQEGSSPRVRGEGLRRAFHHHLGGIIPAGAGRRSPPSESPRPHPDHPRGCGEKATSARVEAGLRGSSPRVRGEEADGLGGGRVEGIIPAGAGRSGLIPPPSSGFWDHPRGCGEKSPKL